MIRFSIRDAALAAGFKRDAAGAHDSRTIMLAELCRLLTACPADVELPAYRAAVEDENALLKRSVATRQNTFRRLRLVMECRRRVKEQQKRIGSAEFQATQFSYQMANDDVERFVVTPELQRDDTVGADPLPPGQVWAMSPGALGEPTGLFRIDVNTGPGSGVRIANVPVPGPFRESVAYAEQNLLVRRRELVGDRDPRACELTVQLRAFDAARSGAGLGLPALLAFCGALLSKSLKGGLVAVGGLNLGGGLDAVPNAVDLAEAAGEKGALALLLPVNARRQLNDLSDDLATRLTILYYADAREALLKALGV
jgi:ATP-dependent Lon protease